MTNDAKILKVLEDLQAGQKALQAGQHALKADISGLKSDVATIKDVQQEHTKHLETLEDGQKTLETGQQTLDLKVEAVNSYQKEAHNEIMGHVLDISEIGDRDQKTLEKRTERIEKHLGLEPVK
jgi:chromosome segregation ATPase